MNPKMPIQKSLAKLRIQKDPEIAALDNLRNFFFQNVSANKEWQSAQVYNQETHTDQYGQVEDHLEKK
jgi:hypothetical protein